MRLHSQWLRVALFITFFILFGRLLLQWLSVESSTGVRNHKILVWHWPFGNSLNLAGDFCKDKFGVPNCIMVDDQSQFSDADVVIFHNRELIQREQKLPVNLNRPKSQRWVWLTMKSPDYNGNVIPFAGYFNWTMTYHQDADIYSPHGVMVPKDFETDEPIEDLIPKGKTHLVCWVVNDFSPDHKRTAIYDKLKTVIPIEVYGEEVNRGLTDDTLLPTISRCFFYLAFENSVFRDYITEELWHNAYRSGAVPVVFGPPREDYEAVAQKDSFIHVNDFSTIEELGQFLRKLVMNGDAYASYFNWRRKYTVVVKHWVELACEFCPKISSMPPHKVYKDLDGWQR
ncbi:alpha-(1,3)-fucosyltransferase 7-like [Sardina pilchardus]|uniref:alpha-(1,3)-fucosyltransferase 7-like n=1 Tax=Sardina pilchardus TaxID=27697 RepID=UPI002E0EA5B7